jgi:hypothetical protein
LHRYQMTARESGMSAVRVTTMFCGEERNRSAR